MTSDHTTYLFGIGAQKAGTTWLANYFQKHPSVHLPAGKEMHYFDELSRNGTKNFSINRRNRFEKITASPEKVAEYEARRAAKQNKQTSGSQLPSLEFLEGLTKMFDADDGAHSVYRKLMNLDRGDEAVVADITPNYAVMTAKTLAMMVKDFPNSKFLFIMRDPAARARSQLQMDFKKGLKSSAGMSFDAYSQKVMAEGKLGVFGQRSKYPKVLKNMEEAIPEENRLVVFYEDLFTDKAIQKICDLIGVPFVAGEYAQVVHGGGKPVNAQDPLMMALYENLAPVYRQMKRRYKDDLPKEWDVGVKIAKDLRNAANAAKSTEDAS